MSIALDTPPLPLAPARGPAFYFNGVTSNRYEVIVEAATTGLRIIHDGQTLLDEWNYAELRTRSAPDGVLRLGRRGETALARVEVRDPALAAAIEARAPALDRGGAAERRLRYHVVIFSLAAIASLVLTAIFGMPVLANRITPLIPLSMEKKLGEAVDKQIGPLLDTGSRGAAFQCGNGVGEVPGRKALDKLVRQLETTARLPYRIRVDVVRRQQANAFALPGGHVYVFEGLLAKSRAPDELAGVIAHEIGHVVRRDGTRAVLQSAGLSFLFGMMLGDFVGGGAVVIAARTVLNSSYSRHAEAAADDYSVKLMENVGGDPRALGAILSRIASDKYDGMTLLRDHPDTKDRIAAINSVTVENLPKQLLNATEWKALKAICSPLPPDGKPQDGKPADQPKR